MDHLSAVKNELKSIETASEKGSGFFHKLTHPQEHTPPVTKLLRVFQGGFFDNHSARELKEAIGILGGIKLTTKGSNRGHCLREWVADDPELKNDPLLQELTPMAEYDWQQAHLISVEGLGDLKQVYRELAEAFHQQRMAERAFKK